MVGSLTAAISSTVRTPSFSISSTTRSLCTTWPRIAPRPPPAAKRLTLRSAMRTPEQKPYLAARLMIIVAVNAFWRGNILFAGRPPLAAGRGNISADGQRRRAAPFGQRIQSALHARRRPIPRAPAHTALRDAVDVRVRHVLLRVSAPAGHSAAHPRTRWIEGRGWMVSDCLHALQRVFR